MLPRFEAPGNPALVKMVPMVMLLVLAGGAPGCGGRTPLFGPGGGPGGGTPDGGDPAGLDTGTDTVRYDTAVSDEGTLEPGPDLPGPPPGATVVARADQGDTYDVGFGRLLWNGSDFGVLWVENVAGRLGLRFARLLADGTLTGPSVPVGDTVLGQGQRSGHVESTAMAWNGDAFTVYFVEGGGDPLATLWRVELDRDGRPLADPVAVLDRKQRTDLLSVLTSTGSSDYVLYSEQGPGLGRQATGAFVIYPPGEVLVQQSLIDQPDTRTFDGIRAGGRQVLYSLHQIVPGDDSAYLSFFDDAGFPPRERPDPVPVYQADTVHLAWYGPTLIEDGNALAMTLWDYDRGGQIARVGLPDQDPAAPLVLTLPGSADRPVLARAADGMLGVVSGGRSSLGESSSQLLFHTVDPASQVSGPLTVVEGGAGCIEAYTLAAAGQERAFGVLWLDFCDPAGRTLSYTRIAY